MKLFDIFKSKERIQKDLMSSLGVATYINCYGLPKKGNEWFDRYNSASELTDDQRIFMSYHTEQSFQSILGESYLLNSRKLYLSEAIKAVEHFINTGEKKYFYEHGQLNGVRSYGEYITKGVNQ